MRRSVLLAPFTLLLGCVTFGRDTGDTQPVADSCICPEDFDTGEEGTDQDGDGFTVEEGDCDDDDIHVNPGRDEDPTDGVDNDCDGRVDEQWSGVTVSWVNEDGASDLLVLDSVGRRTATITLQDPEVVPLWIDHHPEGGWVANDRYQRIVRVDEDGAVEVLADFSELEGDEAFSLYGLVAEPDGSVVFTTLDSLRRLPAGGGEPEVLASWDADYTAPETFELLAYTVLRDPADGTLGLVGYLGGFATYDEQEGFTLHARGDAEEMETYTYAGAHRDGGGWWALDYDASTGELSLARFDLSTGQWDVRHRWTEEDFFPLVLTIDGDSGDFYATANAGWHYTVWRMLADGSYAAAFYDTYDEFPDAQNRALFGIVGDY